MGRIDNFAAGPAALPEAVLRQARDDLLDYRGEGLSVMEMSHRGKLFREIAARTEDDLRALLDVPDSYAVLFLQGGATLEFAAVPLNLTRRGDAVDFVVTGAWGAKALDEASRFCDARKAAGSDDGTYTLVPPRETWRLRPGAAYVHVTLNETIHGVQMHDVPDVGDAILVADVSSCFLCEPLDVTRFGVLYAGAQKNAGPAGLTIVLVRRELLGRARDDVPRVIDWTKQEAAGSMLNTPPCWAWYVSGLVFRHLLEEGGLAAAAKRNREKARRLYAFLDASSLYENRVAPEARSTMNVPILLTRDGIEGTLLAEAEARGLHGLKGHRSVGGLRASLYNAVEPAAVDRLVAFLGDFEGRHEEG
jgi:phosphoserine aminotransferase